MSIWGWPTDAMKAATEYLKTHRYFCSDDLYGLVEEPPRDGNQVGGVVSEMVKIGLIIPTGTYIQSKRKEAAGRTIKLFMSAWAQGFDGDPIAVYEAQRGEPAQSTLMDTR